MQAWYSGTTSSVSIGMAEKRKICNLEAYDNYVRKFKSDWEAAGLFISDKDILCKKEEVNKLRKHWANRMGLLRNKWSKLSQAKKLDNTKEAFRSYQTEIFYEPATIQENLDTPLSSASSREESPPAVVGGRETGKGFTPLSPLDEVSQRHAKRRTDALLSQLREEAEKQMITTTQLLGYLLHRY